MKKFFKNNAILLLFLVAAFSVLFISIYANSFFHRAADLVGENTRKRLLTISLSAARLVSAEELMEFETAEDMEGEDYHALKQKLDEFTQESGILFTYYMRPAEGKPGYLQFIIDNDFDAETQVGLLDEVEYEPAPVEALGGNAACTELGSYSENWDGLISAYAPVYDEAGNIYAIAGVDTQDHDIVSTQKSMAALAVALLVSMVVTLISGFAGFMLYRNKAKQSEQANVAKSQFLSRMSHEIRTPLNAIIGLSRMAGETEDISSINGYLENITTSSNHLLMLINDILDLSKIESGKMQFNEIPVSLDGLIDEICTIISPQAGGKGLRFSCERADNLPRYVQCDTTHVKQVAVNILSNAVKFTPEGGLVTLSVSMIEQTEQSCHLEWKISDNGIGISEKNLAKLFAPFEQGDGSTTRKYGGTGLGLSISKQLVEMMNGDILVDSTPGKGSTFTFDIWLRFAEQPENVGEEPESRPVTLEGKRILLVEDSEINRVIAEDVFDGLGATVKSADNGLSGYRMYRDHPGDFDYIFMDVQMPVMDGYEATRKIRSCGAPGAETIPIIAMTANVFREDVERALESGMDAHVGKPFEITQILEAIGSVSKVSVSR